MQHRNRAADLAAVARHVELGRRRLARQSELVRQLEREGRDARGARQDLRLLKGVQRTFEAYHSAICAMSAENLVIRSREQHAVAIFEQASVGILVADSSGRCQDANPALCGLFGCSREELVGRAIFDLVSADQVDRLRRAHQSVLSGKTHVAEYDLRGRDDRLAPVEISVRLFDDGRVIAFLRDTTERRRTLSASRAVAEELERRVAERTAQLRALARDLESAEDRQRRQIARDLHDDLAQTLSVARIRLADLCRDAVAPACDKAREIDKLIASADRATRSLAAQLAPAVLYELGLVPALEWLAEELERTHGLQVQLRDDGAAKWLSQEARSILYRAVRELLINVAKHAATDSASVDCECRGGRVVVRVADAGVGFVVSDATRASGRSLGLVGIHERVRFIGGTAEVRSVPGDGTVATLSVPLGDGNASAADEAFGPRSREIEPLTDNPRLQPPG